jgi:hypothetical protein
LIKTCWKDVIMKTKYIWILLPIIAAVSLAIYLQPQDKGYIKIDANTATAILQFRRGLFSKTTVTSGAQSTKLKAQTYYPHRLYLRGEQNRNKWQLESRGPWGELQDITIKKGQTTVLKLGPPLLIKPNVSKRGTFILIGYSIIGQAGERYGNVITKNRRRVSTPEVKIIDEGGKVLAAGRFQYG